MGNETISGELDRLAYLIDPWTKDFREWEAKYGATLDKIVNLARASFTDRTDFSLRDTGNRGKIRVLALVHEGEKPVEVALIALRPTGNQVAMQLTNPGDNRKLVNNDDFPTTALDLVDEAWVDAALSTLLARIE